MESIEVKGTVPATPAQIYEAWLDGDLHAKMTGGGATCEPEVGGAFTAWDGYITGVNLALEPDQRLLQRWRSSEFDDNDADSLLEVLLRAVDGGTEIVFRHSEIPDGQGASYEQGWVDHYLEPMCAFFEDR